MAYLAKAFVLWASAYTVSANCAHGTSLFPRKEGQVEVNTFGYSGPNGPAAWHRLNPNNSVCATGRTQSPINLVAGQFTSIPASAIQLKVPTLRKAEFANHGTTVEVVLKEGEAGTALVNGETMKFANFHFHLPSEHLDNGQSAPLEMHMVFESPTKKLGVVGVYIQVDNTWKRSAVDTPGSAVLNNILLQAEQIRQPGSHIELSNVDLGALVTHLNAGQLQTYNGSLTTPPCREGVAWHVATNQQTVSGAAFVSVRDAIGFNSRFAQNSLGLPNILDPQATA